MTDSTLHAILTLSALAMVGIAVSVAAPFIFTSRLRRSQTRRLGPTVLTTVVAAFVLEGIVDNTPRRSAPEPGSRVTATPLDGWLDYYGTGLLWALPLIAATLFVTVVAGVTIVGYHGVYRALRSWLAGYTNPDWESAGVTRADALRRNCRLRQAERRFARGLVDALGPAARSTQQGTVWWIRTTGAAELSTSFHLNASAAASHGITPEDIIAHCKTAEAATEIDKVDLLWLKNAAALTRLLENAAELTTVGVRWNHTYLARPLGTGRSAAVGTVHFGRWPLPARILRSVTRPTGVAVVAGTALAVLTAVASLTPPTQPSRPPAPYRLVAPAAPPTVAARVGHPLNADQQGGDACSRPRSDQPARTTDPCDHAGVDGDRYVVEFDPAQGHHQR